MKTCEDKIVVTTVIITNVSSPPAGRHGLLFCKQL